MPILILAPVLVAHVLVIVLILVVNEESRVSRRRAARKDDACAHGTRAAFMPRVGGALTGENPLLHDPPALGLEGLDGGRDARKVPLRDVVGPRRGEQG